MTDTTRRGFFKLLAGAAIAPVLTSEVKAAVPLILGDGIHDDGPGLNALLRGEVVEIAGDLDAMGFYYDDRILALAPATYALGEPLEIPSGVMLHGRGAVCTDCGAGTALKFVGTEPSWVNNIHLNGFDVGIQFDRKSFGNVTRAIKDW